MKLTPFFWVAALLISISFTGCSVGKGGGLNLFTIEQDIELGKQTKQQIASDPKQFPVLPEAGNAEVYRYIRQITSRILQSGQVAYANEFPWEVYIIDDDETLNAFCAPGGYIYVYTGLIKYLDTEDQLAGVMGHEMAHASLRHSTRQLTQVYGLSILTSIATGSSNPGMLEQIALSLVSLKFSRNHETEADSHSVQYLCPTVYKADGAAGFFIKIQDQASPPEFLSTHPNPGNRVENIQKQAQDLNCKGTKDFRSEYDRIKRML